MKVVCQITAGTANTNNDKSFFMRYYFKQVLCFTIKNREEHKSMTAATERDKIDKTKEKQAAVKRE